MKTGIEQITEERQEQIKKHGRTVEKDVELNDGIYSNSYGQTCHKPQLIEAAKALLLPGESWQEVDARYKKRPMGWDGFIWRKMIGKSYGERLVIAGALIAAEIDRLQNSTP